MTDVYKITWRSKDGVSQKNFTYAKSKSEAMRKFKQNIRGRTPTDIIEVRRIEID